MSVQATLDHVPQAALEELVRRAADVAGFPIAWLSSMERERERLHARLGVDFARTVSCYQADADGRACGHCDACRLRAQGFAAAGVPDPTRYQTP